MTVSSVGNIITYSGNGATTTFTFPFRVLSNENLLVFIKDEEGNYIQQTEGLDYTLGNVDTFSGVEVIFAVAPVTADDNVRLLRQTQHTQLIDYVSNDRFPANTHELALDKLTLEIQDLDSYSVKKDISQSKVDFGGLPITNVGATDDPYGLITNQRANDFLSQAQAKVDDAQVKALASAASATASATSATDSANSATASAASATASAISAADSANSALASLGSAEDSNDSYLLSKAWADTEPDVEVPDPDFPGGYSSRHYAKAAEDALVGAEAELEGYVSAARDNATIAKGWADTAPDVEVPDPDFPNGYSARHYSEIAKEAAQAIDESFRGNYFNAFTPQQDIYRVSSLTIEDSGMGYQAGQLATVLVDPEITEQPAWAIITTVDENGSVTTLDAIALSETGIFRSDPGNGIFTTSSDSVGTGLTISVTFEDVPASTLRDIPDPRLNQTAQVLHNERMNGQTWIFIYADRNGDGIANWIEKSLVNTTSGGAIPDDELTITSASGVRRIATSVMNKVNVVDDGTSIVNVGGVRQIAPELLDKINEPPAPSIPNATNTVYGLVRYAKPTEMGLYTGLAVSPNDVRANIQARERIPAGMPNNSDYGTVSVILKTAALGGKSALPVFSSSKTEFIALTAGWAYRNPASETTYGFSRTMSIDEWNSFYAGNIVQDYMGAGNALTDATKRVFISPVVLKAALDAIPGVTPGSTFPAGTAMLFFMASAPVGWTRQYLNAAQLLPVVSGNDDVGGSIVGNTSRNTNVIFRDTTITSQGPSSTESINQGYDVIKTFGTSYHTHNHVLSLDIGRIFGLICKKD